jgi:hypothetical protein
MLIEAMTHSEIIDKIPRQALNDRFNLSRQRLSYWRSNGVPMGKRIAFARLASDHGIALPQAFFDEADK